MTVMNDLLPFFTQAAGSERWIQIFKTALLAAVCACLLGGFLRLILGRGSKFVQAVSACVSLVAVYLCAVAVYALLPESRSWTVSLPFLTVDSTALSLTDVSAVPEAVLWEGLLRLFIMAVFINLAECFLPAGKNLFGWYGYRMAAAGICLGCYFGACRLVQVLIPGFFGEYAPVALLCIWGAVALTGILRILLTVVLATVNPIVAALYAFFFRNRAGKQITVSILTALLFTGALAALFRLGATGAEFASLSALDYGPAFILALISLYLFGKML